MKSKSALYHMPQLSTFLYEVTFRIAIIAIIGVVFILTFVSNGTAQEKQRAFNHPGIAHSLASIEKVKNKIEAGEEPWLRNWNQLKESQYASRHHNPQPHAHVERGPSNRPDIGSSEFSSDGTAAYTLALRWAISGDADYAKSSAKILDAWSGKLETITNHDARLLVGMAGHRYCNAAEILKHTWGGWPEKNQRQFESMVRKIWLPIIYDFYPSANGNWDAAMLQTMIAAGVFLDDRELFDRAIEYYKNGKGNGAVDNYFNSFGQCQESGRDQTHTQMGLEFLANTCETAWNQGVDLYSAHDNRLLLGFEYTAKYNLGHDVPYETYTSFEKRYTYKTISDISRGRIRPMYVKVFNHYHNRKELPAEFTEQASKQKRRQPESARRVSLPWDSLMFHELGDQSEQAKDDDRK